MPLPSDIPTVLIVVLLTVGIAATYSREKR